MSYSRQNRRTCPSGCKGVVSKCKWELKRGGSPVITQWSYFKGSFWLQRSVNSCLRWRGMLCSSALRVITSPILVAVMGWVVHKEALAKHRVFTSSRTFLRHWGKQKMWTSPSLCWEKFSRREVFVFKKCFHRRANFFIRFFRKSKLDLELLILVSM